MVARQSCRARQLELRRSRSDQEVECRRAGSRLDLPVCSRRLQPDRRRRHRVHLRPQRFAHRARCLDREGNLDPRGAEWDDQPRHQLLAERRWQGTPAAVLDQQLPPGDRCAHRTLDSDLRHRRDRRSPHRSPSRRQDGLEQQQPGQGLEEPSDPRIHHRRSLHLAAGGHPRLRRGHRQQDLAVPYHPAARRARVRDVAEGRAQVRRRRQQLGLVLGRRRARDCLRADRIGDLRLLWRRSARPEPLRELPDRARRAHRQAALALPDGPSRPVGLRQRVGAATGDRPPQRPTRRRRSPGGQDRFSLRLQPRDGCAALAD